MAPLHSSETDFISLFAAEPHLADPGLPWVYNSVTFQTIVEGDRIRFRMEPSYGGCSFTWEREHGLIVRLELSGVASFEARETPMAGLLRLTFKDTQRGELLIQLRPAVSVDWRCERPK